MKLKGASIARALSLLTDALRECSYEEAALEARLLLRQKLGISDAELMLRGEEIFPEKYVEWVERAAARRQSREPIQYILGEWEFMGLPIITRPCALIPRQDTETLAERALELIKSRGYKTALDMCCGTGCIGISMAKLGNISVTLADISPDCLALAGENCALNGVHPKNVIETDLFLNIDGEFDIIAINPPYLTAEEMQKLQPEVGREPALALFGGNDGLELYRRIRKEYVAHVKPGGTLLMEVGYDQAEDVIAMFGGRAILDVCSQKRVVEVG